MHRKHYMNICIYNTIQYNSVQYKDRPGMKPSKGDQTKAAMIRYNIHVDVGIFAIFPIYQFQ